eukprot:Skav202642  [mRNA]  locus=scaffold1942:198940:200537:+ [translate_table: standard]
MQMPVVSDANAKGQILLVLFFGREKEGSRHSLTSGSNLQTRPGDESSSVSASEISSVGPVSHGCHTTSSIVKRSFSTFLSIIKMRSLQV